MRVLSVLNLIHSSRRDSLLLSASRSAANAEPFAKVPSLRSTAVPLNARVVSTASPGAGIAAICSRTRIVATDRSATISKRRAPAGNAVAPAAGVADVGDGVVGAGGDACGAAHETRAASAATASATRNGMRTSGRPKDAHAAAANGPPPGRRPERAPSPCNLRCRQIPPAYALGSARSSLNQTMTVLVGPLAP